MRSGWDTSKETRHELPRVHRAPVRVLGPRADAAGGAGNPPAPVRLPSVRRALRLRTVVPRLPAGALPRAGRAPRAEAPHPAGAVRRVSWLAPGGLAAALAALAQLVRPRGIAPGSAALITAAGVAGMLADSLLGATVQGKFECPACDARFERGNSVCHEPVRLTRGWRWLDNDAVNLAATLVGASVAALGSQ